MPVARLCWMALLALLVAGCASTGTAEHDPIEPDLSILAPAQQMLHKTEAAHVKNFAPRALDAARRRISLARDIIYLAARKGRGLNDTEHQRVTQLVEAARLDAQLALVKTQALAVGAKAAQLRQQLGQQPAGQESINNGGAAQ